MKEKRHITIQIAGQSFGLEDPKESVETIREIERNINKMWSRWCNDFRDMSRQDVLAMVAFQYARYYYSMAKMIEDKEESITEFEQRLDEILLNVDK